jgi:hypothetical protein
MTMQCSDYQQWIPRSFLGDLPQDEKTELDRHLTGCPSCRHEWESYAETLRVMRSAADEPVPRHFFIYPPERAANPWQLFRAMMPRWQAATAGAASFLLLLAAVSISGLRVQAQDGGWTLSFGRSGGPSGSEVAALKAEILRTAEDRNREFAGELVRTLQSEIEQYRTDLTVEQRTQLAAALAGLEERFNNRMALTAADLRGTTQKSMAELYQAVSQQHTRDLTAVNARLDSAVERSEARANQTDVILDTLLQIANQNIKQNGDQK